MSIFEYDQEKHIRQERRKPGRKDMQKVRVQG